MRSSWFAVLVLVSCSSDDADDVVEPELPPCAQFLEHVVDLRVAAATGTASQLADHRSAMKQALGTDFIESCERNLSPAQQRCSIEAADMDAVMACAENTR